MSVSPTLDTLLGLLDRIAPVALAESWDNIGLMAGDPAQEVSGILVALDPTEAVLAEARHHGCNLILTHHPLLFKPLARLRTDLPTGRFLGQALRERIAVVACHTNLDSAAHGVNQVLAERLGLEECRPLATSAVPGQGLGRIGRLSPAVTAETFLARAAATLSAPGLLVAGPLPDKKLATVAVCGGSGSELVEAAWRLGAELYLTSEVKHSVGRWAEAMGFCVVDAGHFATENLIVPELVSGLGRLLGQEGFQLPVLASRSQENPFRMYVSNAVPQPTFLEPV